MSSPYRTPPGRRKVSDNNGSRSWNHQEPVLDVPPLNFVPYSGPPPPQGTFHAPSVEVNATSSCPPIADQPAMVFLPRPSNDEWSNILAATKSGIALSGSAAMAKVGSAVGAVDISESEDKYVVRIGLPGVSRDKKDFSCDITPNGRVVIKGVTSTGEKRVEKNNMVFVMLTENLCPPGEFSLTFQLPGPIDHQNLSAVFGTDGVFEAVVKKRKLRNH